MVYGAMTDTSGHEKVSKEGIDSFNTLQRNKEGTKKV